MRSPSFIAAAARNAGLSQIQPNAFKHNDSTIAAYEALGFQRLRDEATDIGGGFILDDYVYALPLD